MRSIILMATLVAGMAQADWDTYEETRELTLDASKVKHLSINAGAGSMEVVGVDGLDAINVTANIGVSDADEAEAVQIMSKKMTLSLDADDDTAMLQAFFDDGFLGRGTDAYIALIINVPVGTNVTIDDGDGSIDVVDIEGDITIDDGSGSIDIRNVGNVKVEDGSGSLKVRDANGDVSIDDGSGSIKVRGVAGTVTIEDGSGSIKVSDVENDLVIVDDGSGGQKFSNIRGEVVSDT
ncbi:MAG: hypothetical protein K0U72_09415 [Gammaproteobacteria bacterium]|nr:hypothetical protein [Gammaproteobacteria bacterium]